METGKLNLEKMPESIEEAKELALLNKAGFRESNLSTISEEPLFEGMDIVEKSMKSNPEIEDDSSDRAVKSSMVEQIEYNNKLRAILEKSQSPLDKILSKEETNKSKDKMDGVARSL